MPPPHSNIYSTNPCSEKYREFKKNTDKKVNKVFHIYKEIQLGLGAKLYMRKGLLIYE
jgi:hypothetical protein